MEFQRPERAFDGAHRRRDESGSAATKTALPATSPAPPGEGPDQPWPPAVSAFSTDRE
jgi:hypothetical protein